jgi:hypothetical protein
MKGAPNSVGAPLLRINLSGKAGAPPYAASVFSTTLMKNEVP